MKGYFFYQDPGSSVTQGFSCRVKEIDNLEEMSDGFIVSTFNKEQLFLFQPEDQIDIHEVDQADRGSFMVNAMSFDKYQQLATEAMAFCKYHHGKVVLSRVKSASLPKGFSLADFFVNLCKKYNHSFNYCFSIEGVGTWVGATPEVLVHSLSQQCTVYALAGSRDVTNPFEWTKKELAEQAFVSENISDILKSVNLNFVMDGPETVRAGNLEHLLTTFKFDSANSLKVADMLHPTPAVCGTPKKEALQFIEEFEPHSRKFYAGVIGWKKGEELSLFVNLRCAEVTADELRCYVGGGITEKSNPEKEWEETNIKSETLLSVLKKN
ncbi:chorismate-binding protein [Parvicella tangerina]|uniref:Isochorismate synthase MenF n=1 Tax=Parvicella tangerina TaxID=2829795 RepID=A0A916JP69_9FLAO|nr:chorismate-binding protein [Parvicella tangerina]CAG5085232.1 Isochorismate synthase MenF [Parvicella tangerina]